MSKIEAGRMQLHRERFPVAPVLDHITSVALSLAARKNNRFVFNSEGELGEIYADRTKLTQSVLNLLSNACKFTSGGTITLACRRYWPGEREWIEFRVSDTGAGIEREKLAALFKPFSQADASISSKYGGTGLGLSISRNFCRMMGGDITVQSEFGRGSTFTVSLPVDQEPERASESALVTATA